ncbi:efflux RND transporter periplasmic adaptor subunit [Enterovirga aerilata]|uniref:Efflux RND transporter periplasmic adaptor subunit n=1 Tax=Enterovirga aerilata TaxID=2730920 RepID=A0A849I6D7_9HYPH|nr:efflux RND transporter periplasmic adaptor subunit [Enterovirga sp. DB1703]NNM71885.1 efflux RND transporter periplasmic adaptor subunit [Enterovirga sp. DB1703]
MRRYLAALVAAAWLAAGFGAQAQMPGGPPPPVTVAKPVVKEVVEYDDFTGRFDATDFVEIRARVSGYLEKVGFQDGAIVKKGDPLFVIDRRPYKAALDQAQASVVSAQARLNFAQADLERAQALQRSGNIAEQLVDQRRQAFITARAEMDNAEAALRNAQLNYDFTDIRAPISGRIGRKLVTEGNLVNANETLLTTIVSLDPIYFYFDVDERSFLAYSRMHVQAKAAGHTVTDGARVRLTDEREQNRPARIDFVDNRVDQASGTIRLRAIVENKDLFLLPGLFGTIQVAGSPPHRGVLVPDEAIATDQDRRLVWTVEDDGAVTAKVVRPGPKIDGYRLIRSGLTGDETIVINGLQRVRPGAKVTPQRQELPPVRQQ